MRRARALALAACLLVLAGCGGGGGSQAGQARRGSRVVDIYSSLPLSGPLASDGRELVRGMRLALLQAGARAGGFQVRFISLDDARNDGAFSPEAIAANAHRASTDPEAVLYIGEFSSAATEIAMPMLNTGGLGQISPAATYPGLTVSDPGSRPGEPERYFPTSSRTFVRIVPRDTQEAGAALAAMRHDGCSQLAILRPPMGYGARFAALLEYQRASFGMSAAGSSPFPESVSALRAAGLALRASHAGCVYLGTTSATRALAGIRALGAALPTALFYGSGVLCRALTAVGGLADLPLGLDRRFQCTELIQPISHYPGSRQFQADYRLVYGDSLSPGPWALYGYEAMRLALDSVASAGPGGNARGQVLHALLAGNLHHSLLGSYRLDSAGDTTLRAYGLYRGGRGGRLRFERTVVP